MTRFNKKHHDYKYYNKLSHPIQIEEKLKLFFESTPNQT